ncbi:MAG: tyrosine--tRNA ligase [Candidatus Diapherotrites archaeon]|nr:tyrosine--tRNA ligase [Candidatus Diapherotrites archaeon]
MTPEERYALVSRNTEEIITEEELKEACAAKKPSAYIGYAPTGMLHVGHLVPLLKTADFLNAGFKVKFLVADLHAYLDDKKTTWEKLDSRSEYYEESVKGAMEALGADPKDIEFVRGSKLELNGDYFRNILKMAGDVTLARTKRAASEVVRFGDEPKLSGFIYPLMQNEDFKALGVDVCFAGVDQRGIYMLGRELMPDNKPVCVFTPLLPALHGGKMGGKMGASEDKGKIGLHESEESIIKKTGGAWCEAGKVEGNGVLALAEHIVFPVRGELVVERPEKFGGNVAFKSYGELEKAFVDGLHPMDLKNAMGKAIADILEPCRKRLAKKEKLLKAAY